MKESIHQGWQTFIHVEKMLRNPFVEHGVLNDFSVPAKKVVSGTTIRTALATPSLLAVCAGYIAIAIVLWSVNLMLKQSGSQADTQEEKSEHHFETPGAIPEDFSENTVVPKAVARLNDEAFDDDELLLFENFAIATQSIDRNTLEKIFLYMKEEQIHPSLLPRLCVHIAQESNRLELAALIKEAEELLKKAHSHK